MRAARTSSSASRAARRPCWPPQEPPTAGDGGAKAQPAAPPPSGSGALDVDGGGHDLRAFFGYRVCLKCFQYAKEVKGKHRGLGLACAPALKPSAQAERRRKAEKIMRGVAPTGRPLA